MTSENNIMRGILLRGSRGSARLFRNNRGQFYTMDGVRRLVSLIQQGQIKEALDHARRSMRVVRAGLEAPGSSDIIGWKTIVITPEMVGQSVAVFVAIECKTLKGRTAPEQRNFIDVVRSAGGLAGIARSEADASDLLEKLPASQFL